jgi:hypothetical protein
MEFIVKAIGISGDVAWLSQPGHTGFRALVPLKLADVFPDVATAQAAIYAMPQAFTDAGLVFSVETPD